VLLEVSTDDGDEDGEKKELKILQASFSAIHEISAVKLKLPPDLTKLGSRKSVQRAIEEVERRFKEAGSIPLLGTTLLTHSLTHLPTYSLTHSLTHSLTYSLTHLLTYSLTYSLTLLL
jgi:hypothetical protein